MDGEPSRELARNPIRTIIEDFRNFSPETSSPSPSPSSLPSPSISSSSSSQLPPQAHYGHLDKWGIQCCMDFQILPFEIEKDGPYSLASKRCEDFFQSILNSPPNRSKLINSNSSSISLQETKRILETASWQLEIFRVGFEMVERDGLRYLDHKPKTFQRLGVFIPVDPRRLGEHLWDWTTEGWLDVTDRNVQTNSTGPLNMRRRMGCPHHQEWPLNVMCYVRDRGYEEMNPKVFYTSFGEALDLGDGVVWGYWPSSRKLLGS